MLEPTTENRWIKEILELQHEDGSWGYFHSLSQPTKKQPITTEQALRRLRILGLTSDDEPIQRAISYIERCISGEISIPDYPEVKPDYGLFVETMLATWLKTFIPGHELAMPVANRWAQIIEETFSGGIYNQGIYEQAYRTTHQPKGKKVHYFKIFVNYYPLMLLQNMLTLETESRMLDHVIAWPEGIYYVSSCPLNQLPAVFTSRETSRYIAMLEILSGYRSAPGKLTFAIQWLKKYQDETGQWDLGVQANDDIYFPLSDSWRTIENRRSDCTARIERLLRNLGE